MVGLPDVLLRIVAAQTIEEKGEKLLWQGEGIAEVVKNLNKSNCSDDVSLQMNLLLH